jgi:hypothetical protein
MSSTPNRFILGLEFGKPMSGGDRFCSKCGAALPQNASFCPSCGTSAAPGFGQQAPPTPPRWEGRREYEKQEKHEKHEKQEKHEKHEKGRGGDITGAITGGLVLIWLGISFYLAQTGYISWSNWWELFLVGLGVIIILQGVVRYGQGHGPFTGSIIAGLILILIGAAFYWGFQFANLWPLIFVAIGIAVLVSAAYGRRRVPSP